MSRPMFIHDLVWALSNLRLWSRSKSLLDDLGGLGTGMTRAAAQLWHVRMKDYNPNDFLDLPQDDQAKLQNAVEDFRRLSRKHRHDEIQTKSQIEAGLTLLKQICDIVRKPILQEWSTAVEDLIADAEGWSQKHGWITRRKTKEIDEALLETYEAPQLLLYADGTTLVLDPVARFAMGAEGVAELAVVPSYDHMVLPRIADDGWHILSDEPTRAKSDRMRPWNESSFVQAVSHLKALE